MRLAATMPLLGLLGMRPAMQPARRAEVPKVTDGQREHVRARLVNAGRGGGGGGG